MYRPPIVLALITLVACVTTRATPYSTLPVKASAEEVEVFTDTPPSRDYEEIGLIEVEQPGLVSNYGDLVLRARREAAKMGADAIIVTRNPRKSKELMATGSREKNGSKSVTVIEKEVPRIMVKAIVWKHSPANHDSTAAARAPAEFRLRVQTVNAASALARADYESKSPRGGDFRTLGNKP